MRAITAHKQQLHGGRKTRMVIGMLIWAIQPSFHSLRFFKADKHIYSPNTTLYLYEIFRLLLGVSTDSIWSASGFQYLLTFAVPKLQLTARI
jgi:hypothetical protein